VCKIAKNDEKRAGDQLKPGRYQPISAEMRVLKRAVRLEKTASGVHRAQSSPNI